MGVLPSVDLLPLLLPPPLPPPFPPDPPFPPRLLLPLEEEEAPGEEAVPEDPATVTFPRLSPLEDRLSTCFPSVSGGGGFRGTEPEPLFPLLFPTGLVEILVPRPDLALAIPDKPVGLAPEEGGVDLPLPP